MSTEERMPNGVPACENSLAMGDFKPRCTSQNKKPELFPVTFSIHWNQAMSTFTIVMETAPTCPPFLSFCLYSVLIESVIQDLDDHHWRANMWRMKLSYMLLEDYYIISICHGGIQNILPYHRQQQKLQPTSTEIDSWMMPRHRI